MNLQIQYVSEVFTTLVTKNQRRLETGIQRRNEMYEQMKRGEEPSGYRAEFVKVSAKRLVATLEQIAKEFNGKHPDDKCSLQDLIDITTTLMAWLKKASEP